MSDTRAVMKLAWMIHRTNGCAPGYRGPCWGPTSDEREQARRALAGPPGTEPKDA